MNSVVDFITSLFIEIIKRVIDQGQSAIILLPEISLTPQIAGRFKSVFGSLTTLWHSQLTKSQRSSIWLKINNGDYKIVIGARSAIFTPLKNLGIIIVDEEHDSSYKQETPSPRYHARDVAIMRAKIEKSSIVLSSATPSIESYYNYKINKYNHLSLPKRYGKATYPKVRIVDLIEEREGSGKGDIVLSGALLDKIENKLYKNEQILLIQNRRGHSPSVRCSDCGEMAMCLACKTPLTYHNYDNNLKCHICGYIEKESFDNYLVHKDDLEYKYSIKLGTSDVKAVYYAVLDELKEKKLINNNFYENQKETISFMRIDEEDDFIDIMCFMSKVFIILFLIGVVAGFISVEFKSYELSEPQQNNTFLVNIDDL